jgi:hypothetical protein
LIEGLCERPALAKQGPNSASSRSQTVSRSPLKKRVFRLRTWSLLGSILPARPVRQLSARGSTNFVHPKWAGDAFIVGGGALETSKEFQRWFIEQVRAAMSTQRQEQAAIPIYVMPNGDTAGREARLSKR